MNAVQQLKALGQSMWLDTIQRGMLDSGELGRLRDEGISGITSNPTIFEQAITRTPDYDRAIRDLAAARPRATSTDLFYALATDDIRRAADVFRPVYEQNGRRDGMVSIEVSPELAHDTAGTIAEAQTLWERIDRPNLMVKVPATVEGLPAIERLTADGVNINVTLLFSVDQYAAAANAYIEGLEDRVKAGQPVDKVASVASVFVSRIDTAIDKMLDERAAKGANVEALKGKAGIANLKMTYAKFEALFRSPRFDALKAKGAKVQRPLWASTSTKNPKYDDLMYVVNVVGADTVNTMPPATIDALLDHGVVKPDTIHADVQRAQKDIDDLAALGISLHDVTEQLVADGVKSFAQSFKEMLDTIAGKHEALAEKTKA